MRKRVLPRGWYPASAAECNRDIDDFLAGFTPPEGLWRGGIAPHAGWFFSGRAAARMICALAAGRKPDRVVIYGGHLPGGAEPVVYTEGSWETPFGPQAMDRNLAADLVSSGEAVAAYSDFADNTVEIQLPLVRRFFPDVRMIAIHSPASERAVRLGAAVSSLLTARGLTAVYIGSADFTHYGPNYGFSPKGTGAAALRWVKEENDRSLIEKALSMDAPGVLTEASAKRNTCSAGPIASVMTSVSALGVCEGKLLEYYTSYDISPDVSFVGYAAILY
jgi:MEMO1 family protein